MELILSFAALAFLVGTVTLMLRALAGMHVLPATKQEWVLAMAYGLAAALTGILLVEAMNSA